jgi:hypothetical protein
MVPGQGPVASAFRGIGAGSVTPGTVEETVLVRLLDTPDLQRLLRRQPGGVRPVRAPAGDHVVKGSILGTWEGLAILQAELAKIT